MTHNILYSSSNQVNGFTDKVWILGIKKMHLHPSSVLYSPGLTPFTNSKFSLLEKHISINIIYEDYSGRRWFNSIYAPSQALNKGVFLVKKNVCWVLFYKNSRKLQFSIFSMKSLWIFLRQIWDGQVGGIWWDHMELTNCNYKNNILYLYSITLLQHCTPTSIWYYFSKCWNYSFKTVSL